MIVKKEIIPILIRRLVLPFYIPLIALICSFLLLKKRKVLFKQNFHFYFIFFYIVTNRANNKIYRAK